MNNLKICLNNNFNTYLFFNKIINSKLSNYNKINILLLYSEYINNDDISNEYIINEFKKYNVEIIYISKYNTFERIILYKLSIYYIIQNLMILLNESLINMYIKNTKTNTKDISVSILINTFSFKNIKYNKYIKYLLCKKKLYYISQKKTCKNYLDEIIIIKNYLNIFYS